VILARAELPENFGEEQWDNWVAVDLKRGKNHGNNTITDVLR
jgi:hypothetical protein